MAAEVGLRGVFVFPHRLFGRAPRVMEFLSRTAQAPDDDLLRAMATISFERSSRAPPRRQGRHGCCRA